MMRYRITAPSGVSGTSDLNAAAVAMYEAKPGWTVTLLGPSLIIVVDEED